MFEGAVWETDELLDGKAATRAEGMEFEEK